MGVANLPIEVAGGVYTSIPKFEETPGSGEAWAKGAIIVEDGTAGLIGEGGADPSGIIGVATHKWPLSVTSPVVASKAHFIPALPGLVFEGTLNVSAGTYTMALTDVWAEYGLAVDGDGIWYVDQAETTNTRVVVVKALEAAGTAFPRVRFMFLPEATRYGTAPVA